MQDLLTSVSTSSSSVTITARKLLDGVSGVAEAISSVGSKPTKMISSWVSDQIAPTYWVPNYSILVSNCSILFLKYMLSLPYTILDGIII